MSQDDSQITQKEISGIEGSHLLQNDSGDTVHVMQSVEFSGPLPHPVAKSKAESKPQGELFVFGAAAL